MLIPHKGHTDTIQVYSVTVMTHVKALQAGHSSQGTSEPITPAHEALSIDKKYMFCHNLTRSWVTFLFVFAKVTTYVISLASAPLRALGLITFIEAS